MLISKSSHQWLYNAAYDDMMYYRLLAANYKGSSIQIEISFPDRFDELQIDVTYLDSDESPRKIIRIFSYPDILRLGEYNLKLSSALWRELSIKDELINLPKNIQEFFLYHLG